MSGRSAAIHVQTSAFKYCASDCTERSCNHQTEGMVFPAGALRCVCIVNALLLPFVISSTDSDSDRVSELLHLRSQSSKGVIHLNDQGLQRFLTPYPRSYSVFIFFDAIQFHDKPDLHLPELRSEFEIVATSFVASNGDLPSSSKVFFFHVEFRESQSSFALFGVNFLPHIRYVASDLRNLKDAESMSQSEFARLAEAMAEFVETKAKVSVGPIIRPPIISTKQLLLSVFCFIAVVIFSIRKILKGNTILHDPKVWMAGSIFVYFFSVSGGMFNIIRKMPMFLTDRNNPSRLMFFYQGSGMQLGAEGFTVGFLYTLVGLLLAFATHFLVKVHSRTTQRVFMFLATTISFWAMQKVIYLDNWKTGYGIHGFWPSSWD